MKMRAVCIFWSIIDMNKFYVSLFQVLEYLFPHKAAIKNFQIESLLLQFLPISLSSFRNFFRRNQLPGKAIQ